METTYQTRQKERIIACLQRHRDEHISAEVLCAELAREGEAIGRATIYRQLNRLFEEGKLQKYSNENLPHACFQWRDTEHEQYHLKCNGCGQVHHFSCDWLQELQRHVSREHSMRIDETKTVFYGLCPHCVAQTLVSESGAGE